MPAAGSLEADAEASQGAFPPWAQQRLGRTEFQQQMWEYLAGPGAGGADTWEDFARP